MDLTIGELQTPPIPAERKQPATGLRAPSSHASILRVSSLNRASAWKTPASSRKAPSPAPPASLGENSSWQVRLDALRQLDLAQIKPEDVPTLVEPIGTQLLSAQSQVVLAACEVVEKMCRSPVPFDTSALVEPLMHVASSLSLGCKAAEYAAGDCLKNLYKLDAAPELKLLGASSKNDKARLVTSHVLAELASSATSPERSAEIANALVRLLGDGDAEVRAEAREGVARLHTRGMGDVVKSALAGFEVSPRALRQLAIDFPRVAADLGLDTTAFVAPTPQPAHPTWLSPAALVEPPRIEPRLRAARSIHAPVPVRASPGGAHDGDAAKETSPLGKALLKRRAENQAAAQRATSPVGSALMRRKALRDQSARLGLAAVLEPVQIERLDAPVASDSPFRKPVPFELPALVVATVADAEADADAADTAVSDAKPHRNWNRVVVVWGSLAMLLAWCLGVAPSPAAIANIADAPASESREVIVGFGTREAGFVLDVVAFVEQCLRPPLPQQQRALPAPPPVVPAPVLPTDGQLDAAAAVACVASAVFLSTLCVGRSVSAGSASAVAAQTCTPVRGLAPATAAASVAVLRTPEDDDVVKAKPTGKSSGRASTRGRVLVTVTAESGAVKSVLRSRRLAAKSSTAVAATPVPFRMARAAAKKD